VRQQQTRQAARLFAATDTCGRCILPVTPSLLLLLLLLLLRRLARFAWTF
jgi:hypothetical protein